MNHTRISLDGDWMFVHRADRHAPESGPRRIAVPGPWQAQFADLRMKGGIGLYRRAFSVPALGEDLRIYIHFGAVFHHATLWINGARVGGHEGGFLPFSFDITDLVRPGLNEAALEAESPTDDVGLYPDAPFAEIPVGKQSWYGPLSGIWQSVHLEFRPVDHIERIRIRCHLEDGRYEARVQFRAPLRRDGLVLVRVLGPGGEVCDSQRVSAAAGDHGVGVAGRVADCRPWSLDDPALYRVEAELLQDGGAPDIHGETFGYRTFEARDGAFFLNGERLYLRGALDQDYYPGTICTVPSTGFLEEQFRRAKELGLNCLRLHIKVPDPRYYEVADRLGLLVWTELPNGGISTERSRQRKESLIKGIIDRDSNHPSIVIWTIINENWGVDLVHDPDHRAWLNRVYHWTKAYDPGRVVVDNSPLAPSFHVETDIADYHFYAAIPDHRANWDRFVERLAGDPAWLFSPEGDARIRGDEPRVCSEFGNWGLPVPDDLKDAEGREPWWFESGHDWAEGVMYPHGIEQRFEDWSLDRVFGSLSSFARAAQGQQFRALKYQIEAMRRRSAIAGYVITELTDVHWESNGLLDMNRNRRAFHDVFARINADVVLAPHWERLSYWEDEEICFGLSVANGSGRALEGVELAVSCDGVPCAVRRLDVVASGEVLDLGTFAIMPRSPRSPGLHRLDLTLTQAGGTLVAANDLTFARHRRSAAANLHPTRVWTPEAGLHTRLEALGYRVAETAERADVLLSRTVNPALAPLVREGATLLLLPETQAPLHPFFPHWQNARVQAREETVWQGDWASSFAWLRRAGPFACIPGEPLVDAAFDRVIPSHVIAGCNLMDFQSRVHAGIVVGWIHRPAALVVERQYGRGRLVVSTFRLFRDPPEADPTATVLLRALTDLALQRDGARQTAAPAEASLSTGG